MTRRVRAAPGGGTVTILNGSSPRATAEGSQVKVAGPFAPGPTLVQFVYSVPYSGADLTIEQRLPIALNQVIVMAQKAGRCTLGSAQLAQQREVRAEGDTYIVGQGPGVAAGNSLNCRSLVCHMPHLAAHRRLGVGGGHSVRGRLVQFPHGGRVRRRPSAKNWRGDAIAFAELTAIERQRHTACIRQWPRGMERPAPRAHLRARIRLCGARQLKVDFSSLTFADVTLDFRRRRALNRDHFNIDRGEIIAVLGPNGAGKTTLLFVAATLLAPSAGQVRFGEWNVATGGAELRRLIGLVGHDLYVYADLSAVQNLRFFASLYNVDQPDVHVESALQRAGLDGRGHESIAISRAECASVSPSNER